MNPRPFRFGDTLSLFDAEGRKTRWTVVFRSVVDEESRLVLLPDDGGYSIVLSATEAEARSRAFPSQTPSSDTVDA